MNLKEIKKIVGSLQRHLFRNSNSFSVGMLKSHFKGAGLQFKEHQVYNVGDDVRFIDWKLSAKTNNTFIKTFEEERNIEIVTFLDFSESMLMGANDVSKLKASIELICLLYLLAEKSKDRVRVIICANSIQTLPPVCGNEGLALFISVLDKIGLMDKNGKINLGFRRSAIVEPNKRLAILKSYIARNKEVVLFSDLSELNDYKDLNKLTYRRNMHTFQIVSPIDLRGKSKFSIFTQAKAIKGIMKAEVGMPEEIKGKLKILNVEERYLEDFVREML